MIEKQSSLEDQAMQNPQEFEMDVDGKEEVDPVSVIKDPSPINNNAIII